MIYFTRIYFPLQEFTLHRFTSLYRNLLNKDLPPFMGIYFTSQGLTSPYRDLLTLLGFTSFYWDLLPLKMIYFTRIYLPLWGFASLNDDLLYNDLHPYTRIFFKIQ